MRRYGQIGSSGPALSDLGRVPDPALFQASIETRLVSMRERLDHRMSIRKIVFTMLALFAFSALFAATASAEETLLAFWLWNNVAVSELLSTTTKGSLTLRDTETIVGSAAVLCTAEVDGSVGVSGEDETTAVLNALGLETGALGTRALLGTGAAAGEEGSECKTVEGCAEGTAASPIEVNPLGLPWHTLLFLKADGTFLVLILGATEIGYELLCLILGINAEDTCKAPANDFEFEVVNDLEDVAIPANSETTPLATCTQSGGKATGHNIADELTFILPLEGLLSVSSEP